MAIYIYDISKTIKQLNPNKSVGLDGIGPKLIKLCGDHITVPLSFVINRSISQATFPDTLKNAFVIPIYKSGPKSDPNNYRPTFILPTVSKIIERHVATQFFDYLKNIIYCMQTNRASENITHVAQIF